MDWHFASALERVADLVPERTALINDTCSRTWGEYEQRAARLADCLHDAGVGPGSKVGLYLHNSNEYLESHFAALKLRATPVNINYRYREAELLYILDNADVEALVFQETYAGIAADIAPKLPRLKCLIQVSVLDEGVDLVPGALAYEPAIAAARPRPRQERSSQDIYMLYTGGTTGLPKGVMYANGPLCQQLVASYRLFGMPAPGAMSEIGESLLVGLARQSLPTSLVACPLMHGTGIWVGALTPHLAGGAVVTISQLGFDPARFWRTVERHRATYLTIVGDAFARPLLAALDAAQAAGTPYDLGSVRTMISSGVMWSQEVKEGLLRHLDVTLIDAVGSSEVAMGGSVSKRGHSARTGTFDVNPGVRILSADGRLLAPGSDEVGLIATPGSMIGYYKDPEKTREVIREVDGRHYVIPGDYARYEADGSIRLLGRGSTCINTAGEKVFPEEVEEVLKLHAAVVDCLVVGEPDERFGQRVVAVVSVSGPADPAELIAHAREQLAGYKVPRAIFVAPAIQRLPNGKPDYRWAASCIAALQGEDRPGSDAARAPAR